RRNGTRRLYRARPDGLAELPRFLDELWGGQLDALKREAEREEKQTRGNEDRTPARGARDPDRRPSGDGVGVPRRPGEAAALEGRPHDLRGARRRRLPDGGGAGQRRRRRGARARPAAPARLQLGLGGKSRRPAGLDRRRVRAPARGRPDAGAPHAPRPPEPGVARAARARLGALPGSTRGRRSGRRPRPRFLPDREELRWRSTCTSTRAAARPRARRRASGCWLRGSAGSAASTETSSTPATRSAPRRPSAARPPASAATRSSRAAAAASRCTKRSRCSAPRPASASRKHGSDAAASRRSKRFANAERLAVEIRQRERRAQLAEEAGRVVEDRAAADAAADDDDLRPRVFTRATLPRVGGRLDPQARRVAFALLAQRLEQLAHLLERKRSRRRRLALHRRRLGPPGQHRAIVAAGLRRRQWLL